MSDWKPGTVAKATVRGVEDVQVMRSTDSATWVTGTPIRGCDWHGEKDVTDVRPLVVLDPGPDVASTVEALLDMLPCCESDWDAQDHIVKGLADQIEAQTKPPRIPEPGLWGVVEAKLSSESEHQWKAVRYPSGWIVDDGGEFDWSDLIDPVLVRRGLW